MSVWEVPAEVIDVHDGDTIRVRADLGWHVQIESLVRIDGINAPELKTAAGKVARDVLAQLIPAGSKVVVVSKQMLGSFEKYGRVLADVTYTPNGRDHALSVAGEMVATGHAKPWDGSGTKPV